MAPYPKFPNYTSSEERTSISYKVYQQNEYPTKWQNDNHGPEPDKEQIPSVAETGLERESEKSEEHPKRKLQFGDRVIVKKMPVQEMKQLQKNHGEWNPKMEESMGREGLILQVLPGQDLLVRMSTMVQWVLNPKCIELLDAEVSLFVMGDKAKLKSLETDEMRNIQERKAVWVPILAEMKGRLCDVIGTHTQNTVIIKISNGYVFCVNQGLLEKVDSHEKEQPERCFTKGDMVQVHYQGPEKIMKHYAKYGLKQDPNILAERKHEGKVIFVTFGWIIHVRMNNGNIVTCCPPILELKKQTALPKEKTDHDVKIDFIIYYLNPLVQKAYLSDVPASKDSMMDYILPPGLPQDQREEAKTMFHKADEAMLKEFLEMQEMEETGGKIQSTEFKPGDRVSVKKMSIIDLSFKQLNHGGLSTIMFMTLGRKGFVVKVFTETGDLQVHIDGFNLLLVFNPDCIDLVAKAEPHSFRNGQISRFKNLSTEEMEKLQENHGGWVPLMKDMKQRECKICECLPYLLMVETMDGYKWSVNPKLIEQDVLQQPQEKQEGCFQVGDFVRVKDMRKEEMKGLFKHHGVQWSNQMFHMKNQIGRVLEVKMGRIIHVSFSTGQTTERKAGTAGKPILMLSCRPVLDLVEKDEIPDYIEKDFARQSEEAINLPYCSQQRVSVQLSAAGGMYRVDACPSPKDFLIATATGNIQATRFILKKHPQWVDIVSDDGTETALMNACVSGNIAIVKELVEHGARVNLENIENNTPVIIAAWRGEKEILQYLLDKGSILNRKNSQGRNAIHAAILGGSEECLGLLLQRCTLGDFQTRSLDGMTPRLLAIRMKNERILKKMIASDHFNKATKDESGALPLHEAALWNNAHVAKICLERHPKGLNEKKQDLWTPLHLAAFNNSIDVLKLLIENGCKMNEVNEDQETPLFLAVKNCHQQVVELLLKSNADPNIPNEDGETCLHHIFKLQEKSIDEVLESPLLPEPIVISTKSQWLSLARVLISKGARSDIEDNQGKTALDLIKDDTFKAEILVLIDALNTVDNNLADFKKKTANMSSEERLQRAYQTNNFAVRYFGVDGGILEVAKANVRMYVPPGAIKGQEQLIYIYLDPVNTIEGKIAPVVEVGPPGTTFNKKISLSYPHCAADESKWKISTMISQQIDSKYQDWKDLDVIKGEGVESIVKKGRVVIKTPHFTRFTSTGESKTGDAPVEKYMRIGAFGKDHKKGQTIYQFRVRTWDDYETQHVQDTEKYLDSKPIDADRPLLVRHKNKEDVTVKVNDVKKGWKDSQKHERRLRFPEVWNNKFPSCPVILEKTKGKVNQDVGCKVRAFQKSHKKEHVEIAICPETIEVEDRYTRRDTGQGLEEQLFGTFPNIPGVPKQLYGKLCASIHAKNDIGLDWRCIANDLGNAQFVYNLETLYRKDNDSPANYVLRNTLERCYGEGSDNPLNDLMELFQEKQLHDCSRILKEYLKEKNPQHE